VTFVFFLFLTHLGLGLLAMLPFVPDRAGRGYFKFCSASAAFAMTAGLGLVLRRFGLAAGTSAPGGGAYRALLLAATVSLACAVVYNRAWHFSWKAIRPVLLAASLAAGLAAVILAAPSGDRLLPVLTDVTSILLLGAATSAMVLGHWYLVVLDLPITALRRLTVVLAVTLVLRAVVVGLALVGPVHAGYADARAVAAGLWSPDGVFVWMRLLFGLAGPLSLLWFIWKTVEIRSTQSATGILYVQLFLVLAGELLAKYLRVAAGFPL
jgi:protein NrfD